MISETWPNRSAPANSRRAFRSGVACDLDLARALHRRCPAAVAELRRRRHHAMHRYITFFMLLTLVGCSSPIRSGRPLVGRWSTGCVMSQLGPSMSRFTFRSDQTCDVSFTAWFMRLSDCGTYRVDGDTIILQGRRKTSTMRFTFDGDHLLLREPGETFRLHKIGNAR